MQIVQVARPSSLQDGDGDVVRKLLPWKRPQKEHRDPFPSNVRKFERQIQREHPKSGSCFRVNFMEAFMEAPI